MTLKDGRGSESSFLLFEYLPDVVIVTDPDFKIEYLNPIASGFFKYQPIEIIGQSITVLLSPAWKNLFHDKLQNPFNRNTGKVLIREAEIETKNKHILPVEFSVSRGHHDQKDFNILFVRNLTIRQRYINEIHLLKDIATDVSATQSFTEALKATVGNICKYYSWDYGEAWKENDTGDYFELVTGCLPEESPLKGFSEKSKRMRIPVNRGVPHAVANGDFEWSASIASYERFERKDLASEYNLNTCVGISVRPASGLVISLLFFSVKEIEKDESVISILKSLCDQMAIILDKKQTDEKLSERENFINQITELSPNIISVHDIINNKNLYTNKELTDTLGYSHEDIIKMGDNIFQKLVYPEDLPKVYERNEKFKELQDNEVTELTVRLLCKTGGYKWIHMRSKIFKRTESGQPWITLSNAIDVTETTKDKIKLRESENKLKNLNATLEQKVEERTTKLKSTTEQLKAREELLLLIMNSVPAYISYIDSSYVYRFVNDYYQKLSFIEPGSVGKKVKDALSKEYYNKILPYLKIAFLGKTTSYETSLILKDGSETFGLITLIPHKQDGEVKGVVVLGVDLTERVLFERRLSEQNKQLREINHDLDSFVYIASHDLKAPISNIQGLVNLMGDILKERDKLSDDIGDIIEMVKSSVDQFNNTIFNLTEVNRIQENYSPETGEVDLEVVIAGITQKLGELIEESQASIEVDVRQCARVVFSENNLETVIYNLLLNAIQYRSPFRPLKVKISCNEENEFYLIKVEDNGLGIKKENLGKIFNLFKRYNSTGHGNGVDLYIVRRLVEGNGGKVEVESEEKAGTVFKVYLRKSYPIINRIES